MIDWPIFFYVGAAILIVLWIRDLMIDWKTLGFGGKEMSNTVYTLDGTKYIRSGWLGYQLKSKEFGINLGDVRMINGYLMYAYAKDDMYWLAYIIMPFHKPEIFWCLCDIGNGNVNDDNELIRKFDLDLPK